MLPILTLCVLAALLSSLAWGPGSHLEFAQRVLRRRKELLTSSVADLIGEERRGYLYGNIAADIINFKAWGGHYNHCHRWTIVDEMRELADSPIEEAFCLGYLSHLAADTIAHNHFVPYHLARYARGKALGHVYWEMNADRFVSDARWKAVTALKADRELEALDELVNRTVQKKALSMRTNKLIFNHVLLVSERERWRAAIAKFHPLRQVRLERGFLEVFRRAAVERIRLALHPRGLAKLAHVDTNGKAAQRRALRLRERVVAQNAAGTSRRAASEEVAAEFLEGMQTPPDGDHDSPHW